MAELLSLGNGNTSNGWYSIALRFGFGLCYAFLGICARATCHPTNWLVFAGFLLSCDSFHFTGATARSQTSTSLYIPGFDPQAVSANVAGIGADGATTWILHQGSRDPTDTSSYPDFIGTGAPFLPFRSIYLRSSYFLCRIL